MDSTHEMQAMPAAIASAIRSMLPSLIAAMQIRPLLTA